MTFLKKSCYEQMWHLGPRMLHPTLNSGSTVKIILQFCTMKGTKETWELMVFQKEILFRAIWLFCDKNDVTSS